MIEPHTNFDVSVLKIFLGVAETGNMSQAAKMLGITQPAVSNAIQKLEGAFGVQLFDRAERPLQMTASGRVLQKRAEAILNDLGYLAKEVQGSAKQPQVNLRIGFSDSYGGTVVPEFLYRLVPKVSSLSAYTASTPKIIGKFLNDEIDIAIATTDLSDKKGVNSILVFTERYVIVTPEKYENRIQSLADLARISEELPVIRFNDESLDSIQIERILRQCNAKDGKRIEVDTNQSVMSLVRRGAGWTVMPPLGIWLARGQTSGIVMHDTVSATRSFFVQYRSPVFGCYAEAIARETADVLRKQILPQIQSEMPGLYKCIHLDPGYSRFKSSL